MSWLEFAGYWEFTKSDILIVITDSVEGSKYDGNEFWLKLERGPRN